MADPHINPATGVWDDNYYANNHLDPTTNGGGGGGFNSASIDPVALAKQLQQFQVQANQPAIQTLQTGSANLDTAYKQLLDSIKGGQQVAVNAQTQVTNNEMAGRGILPSSTLYGQNMQNALLPVNTQYASLYGQTGLTEQQSLLDIAGQIASLQAGNPSGAATTAGNYASALAGAQAAYQAAVYPYTHVNVPSTSSSTSTTPAAGTSPTAASPVVQAAQQQQQAINKATNPVSSLSYTPVAGASASMVPATTVQKKTNNPSTFNYNPNAFNTYGLSLQ